MVSFHANCMCGGCMYVELIASYLATLAGIQNGFIYAAAGLPELLRPIYNIIKNEHTDYSCANQVSSF